MAEAYAKLKDYVRETYALRSAASLLSWDQETMMPTKGAQGRAESLGALTKVVHERYAATELGDLLEQCLQDKGLGAEENAFVREIRRDRDKTVKVPVTLAQELARTASLGQRAWVEAKPKNDKAAFNPWLEKMLDLRRREAECLGYEENPYDALLDNYEPGMRASRLRPLFHRLKEGIVPLLRRIQDSGKRPDPDLTGQAFGVDVQRDLNRRVLEEIGFDFGAGRLDVSAHPFCDGIHPADVRITTRYAERDMCNSLFSTLHEAGHALYEQGLPIAHTGGPLAEAVSLGIHESQSRLWENQVGRSEAFWKRWFPRFREAFPSQLAKHGPEAFLLAANHVQPSLIRVEADEVTYNLHIILRFELELALFNGELEVAGLEEAWNKGMREMFGIEPDSPSHGYMQDVHWGAGLMGYFPTYSLGNVYSAQIFAKAREALPSLEQEIEAGRFAPLLDWLRLNIHVHGRRYAPEELVKRVTGAAPDAGHLLRYLEDRYGRLYGL